jgi:putative membrane protein
VQTPWIKRGEVPILLANCVYVIALGGMALARLNYEFVIYGLVIVFFFALIVVGQRRVEFTLLVLWGLTAWGLMHMAGGTVFLGGRRLYDILLLPIMRDVGILKYDQLVHTVGFGFATLVAYHLLRSNLRERPVSWKTLSLIVLLAGMGLGALNEVVEFFVTVIVPESGVGGYLNTALDLVFNTLGALLAVGWINLQRLRQNGLPLV